MPVIANLTSLNVCQLTCGEVPGNLWPQPTQFAAERTLSRIDPFAISVETESFREGPSSEYWSMAMNRFYDQQRKKLPEGFWGLNVNRHMRINLTVLDSDDMKHDLNTIEEYNLVITPIVATSEVFVLIGAFNFYGARHALETLSQLMVYDDFNHAMVVLDTVGIIDSPAYAHRGISMDTSRNFYSVDDIKKTIDGMATVIN